MIGKDVADCINFILNMIKNTKIANLNFKRNSIALL